MSVSGILSSNLFSYQNQNVNNNQQFQQDFAQLGQDLQSGNLTAAQSDLSTLEQLKPQATTSTQNNPVAQAFSQLSQDLQSGNLSAAQQDYTNVQQDIQKHISGTHHHHHHEGGGGESGGISQLFQQLGQDLQSGNVSSAQQVYATLQQDLQQFGQQGTEAQSAQSTPGISVSA
ncbi:MAG: hypothetical protein WCB05_21865 [Candidatus Sulfotelmatobacter sp.]|jgi:outer membrane protein assembly factor BamD (BamD/ComL family)